MQAINSRKAGLRFSLRSLMVMVCTLCTLLAIVVGYDQLRTRVKVVSGGHFWTHADSRYSARAVWRGNKSRGMQLVAAVVVLKPSPELKGSTGGLSSVPPTGPGLDLDATHGIYLDGQEVDTSGTNKVYIYVHVYLAAKGETRLGLVPVDLTEDDIRSLDNVAQSLDILDTRVWQDKVVPQIDELYALKVQPWIDAVQRDSRESALGISSDREKGDGSP